MRRRYDAFQGRPGRYDRNWRVMPPPPWGGWYPGVFWGTAPYLGAAAWTGIPDPYGPFGYGPPPLPERPPRRPRESPTFGRGADRELQRWAQRYGYDLEFEIRPRRGGRQRRDPRGG